jgi:hypothetical protein
METRHPAKRPFWAGTSDSRFLTDELSIKKDAWTRNQVLSLDSRQEPHETKVVREMMDESLIHGSPV